MFDELLERDWVVTPFGKPSKYAAALRQSRSGRGGQELLSSSLRTVHTSVSRDVFWKRNPER